MLGLKKYVKEAVGSVLQQNIDTHNFPFLRQLSDASMRRANDYDPNAPFSDEPKLRSNVLQFLARLKRVIEAIDVDTSSGAATNARVAKRTAPISCFWFLLLF